MNEISRMFRLCDQISDGLLDEIYKQDKESRVAIEAMTTTGLVVIAGEVTTKAKVDYQHNVRRIIKEIGYNKPEYGFNADDVGVLVSIHEQSSEIAQGVNEGEGLHKD